MLWIKSPQSRYDALIFLGAFSSVLTTHLFVPSLTPTNLQLATSGLDIEDLPEPVEKAKPAPSPVKEIASPAPEPAIVEKAVIEPPAPVDEPEPAAKSTNYFAIGAILAVVVHLILKVNAHYTSPLGPGDALASGRSRGVCGLLAIVPFSSCEVSVATMGDDGIFTVTQGDEVIYKLSGNVCGDDADCVDGLAIDEDGKVTIGGSRVKTLIKASADLKPWPFAEDVTIPKTLL